MRVPHLNRGTL